MIKPIHLSIVNIYGTNRYTFGLMSSHHYSLSWQPSYSLSPQNQGGSGMMENSSRFMYFTIIVDSKWTISGRCWTVHGKLKSSLSTHRWKWDFMSVPIRGLPTHSCFSPRYFVISNIVWAAMERSYGCIWMSSWRHFVRDQIDCAPWLHCMKKRTTHRKFWNSSKIE